MIFWENDCLHSTEMQWQFFKQNIPILHKIDIQEYESKCSDSGRSNMLMSEDGEGRAI